MTTLSLFLGWLRSRFDGEGGYAEGGVLVALLVLAVLFIVLGAAVHWSLFLVLLVVLVLLLVL
jgi:hypothetical protein